MNRDDIHTNINSIQFRGADIWMIVVVPTCELLFSTSAYGLYLPSHLSLLSVFTLCSEYFIKRLSKQYLLYYLDALRALRDSVDGQYSWNMLVWNCVAPSSVLDKTRHNHCVGHKSELGGGIWLRIAFYSVVRGGFGGYGKSFLLTLLLLLLRQLIYICTSLMSAFHISYPGRATRALSLLMLIDLSRGTDPRPEWN